MKKFIKIFLFILFIFTITTPVSAETESSTRIAPFYADKWTYYSNVYGFKQDGRWGLADANGVRCSARYKSLEALNEDFIIVSIGYSGYGLIDKYCNTIVPIEFDSIEINKYKNIIGKRNNFYEIRDEKGRRIFSGYYDDLEQITSEYFRYKDGYYYGVIDKQGNNIMPADYEMIEYLTTDIFSVQKNAIWGLAGINGIIICEPQYDSIKVYSSNLFIIEDNFQYGLIGKSGNVLTVPQFDNINKLNDLFFLANKNNKTSVFDITGKALFEAKYKSIRPYKLTFFKVESFNKKFGIIDSKGKSITNGEIYDKIEEGKDNFIKVKKDGKWGAYSLEGKQVLPCTYGPFKINNAVKNIPADANHTKVFRTEQQNENILFALSYYYGGEYTNAQNALIQYYKYPYTDFVITDIAKTLTENLAAMGYYVSK